MASEAVKKTSEEEDASPPRSEVGENADSGVAEVETRVVARPAHHARRPMNAFLIFCKRHRTVVRKYYPNLENRAITKILGDWWGQLDNSEKESYIRLAQQYKEAFLKAFPDFKWYKLPAPPLRTLVTRPSNHSKPHKMECHLTCGPIVPGKLADESQMGRLSSLILSSASSSTTMTASQGVAGSPLTLPTTGITSLLTIVPAPAPASPRVPTTPVSLALPTVPKPPKKRYLQGLFETSCAGDQTSPDLGMETQELVSPTEKHLLVWNRQQFTFGDGTPAIKSSHCSDFTTLPLPTLHSPQDDAINLEQYSLVGACSPNADDDTTIPELDGMCSSTGTAFSSESTFHTSKQVIIDFVVDKLVNNESCFQAPAGYVPGCGGTVATSEPLAAVAVQNSGAKSFLSSGVEHGGVANLLHYASATSIISLPPLRGVMGSFMTPHTTTRRDSAVNSFCSQPVSYVTAPSSSTEIVTWAQDINVSRIVASLTNNNVYISKGKNGMLEVENLGTDSTSSECNLADCISTNVSDNLFPVEDTETLETASSSFLINCKVYDAASLKGGCENALISFTEYSSKDCIMTSDCNDSKALPYLSYSDEPKLPQSDLSLKFFSNSLEISTCYDGQETKHSPIPAKAVLLGKEISCPVTSHDGDGGDGKSLSVPNADASSCKSSCGESIQVQNHSSLSSAGGCNVEDVAPKPKSLSTNKSSCLKMFSLKEHLKRYKAEVDFGEAQSTGNDDREQSSSIVDPPHNNLLPTTELSAERSTKPSVACSRSSISEAQTLRIMDPATDIPGSCVKATSAAGNCFKSGLASTNSKKNADALGPAGKPLLPPQRQTSARACKGQRYKEFMKETSRSANKRARKAVLCNVEGSGNPSRKKETHQQVSVDSAGEVSADTCKLPSMSLTSVSDDGAEELTFGTSPSADPQPGASLWHSVSSLLPLRPVASPRRERLDSASSCGSSERTFSACSDGSLDAFSSVSHMTCAVTTPCVASSRTTVLSCTSVSGVVSPVEKKKRKLSEAFPQQDSPTNCATKKSCETFDFNLDEKIGALPPLSLEDFQIKKKNRKKRCFPVLKTSPATSGLSSGMTASHSSSFAVVSAATGSVTSASWKATALVPDAPPELHTVPKHPEAEEVTVMEDLVGSQKRKARRKIIRRLGTHRVEGDRVGTDLWIGLLLLADAATSRSKMVVPGCSQHAADAPVFPHTHSSLS